MLPGGEVDLLLGPGTKKDDVASCFDSQPAALFTIICAFGPYLVIMPLLEPRLIQHRSK